MVESNPLKHIYFKSKSHLLVHDMLNFHEFFFEVLEYTQLYSVYYTQLYSVTHNITLILSFQTFLYKIKKKKKKKKMIPKHKSA